MSKFESKWNFDYLMKKTNDEREKEGKAPRTDKLALRTVNAKEKDFSNELRAKENEES